MLSFTEENYLKALYKITVENMVKEAGTNELAVILAVKPATVNDMLKKLKGKELVEYEKYGKIKLSFKGQKNALEIIRKHRLWETFLFQKLEFSWDEVHEVAEQLEHIQSTKLIDKLDEFLDFPTVDPHGDPIPNKDGEVTFHLKKNLSEINVGKSCRMVAVKDNSSTFLQYVDKIGLRIDYEIIVTAREDFDSLMTIEVKGKQSTVSHQFAENILVR